MYLKAYPKSSIYPDCANFNSYNTFALGSIYDEPNRETFFFGTCLSNSETIKFRSENEYRGIC